MSARIFDEFIKDTFLLELALFQSSNNNNDIIIIIAISPILFPTTK